MFALLWGAEAFVGGPWLRLPNRALKPSRAAEFSVDDKLLEVSIAVTEAIEVKEKRCIHPSVSHSLVVPARPLHFPPDPNADPPTHRRPTSRRPQSPSMG